MLRPAPRCLFRQGLRPLRRQQQLRSISSTPPHLRPRSWRSSAIRWGIAAGGLYWYTTSPLFAAEPDADNLDPYAQADDASLPTLASLSPSSRFRRSAASDSAATLPNATSSSPSSIDPNAPSPRPQADGPDADGQSPQGLEDEAAQQGAFNEETGEINWDCPCLGGMAHGPCGEEFKAAFSCFVFSKEEPKGMDCIDNFKSMQECFRKYPEIYSEELRDDDEEDGAEGAEAKPQDGAVALAKEAGEGGKLTGAQAASNELATGKSEKPDTLATKGEPVAQTKS